MTNDEQDLTPNAETPASGFDESADDLRYAPPTESVPSEASEANAASVPFEAELETTSDDELQFAPPAPEPEPSVDIATDSLPVTVTDGLDIEAALAAVSTLSDVIAEQEAVEQARVARIEAEALAKAEHQARLEHPERFFAVPPLTGLKRGQLASVIPALWLIGLGAWLTFTLATTHTAPDPVWVGVVIALGIGLSLITRWLASHRWAHGSLFFGLLSLLWGGLFFYVNQPGAFGFAATWPLFVVACGLAMVLTRLLTPSAQSRLMLPGLILIMAGIAGAVITMGLLPDNLTFMAASLWPVALVIMVAIWVFPLVFRQRQ